MDAAGASGCGQPVARRPARYVSLTTFEPARQAPPLPHPVSTSAPASASAPVFRSSPSPRLRLTRSAFNVLFEGRKLWCLAPPAPDEGGTGAADVDWLPPSVSTSGCLVLAPPALRWFRHHLAPSAAAAARQLVWFEQRPGEVMCVPHGWWHATLNLELCLAFTQNVVLPHGARAAIAALDALGDRAQADVAQALRKVTSERHS